jgi:hypothetical protein
VSSPSNKSAVASEFNFTFATKVIAHTFAIPYDNIFRICALLSDRVCVVCGKQDVVSGTWTCKKKECCEASPSFEDGYARFTVMPKKFAHF